ncbi:MAG: hypothetical protein HC856_01565 [Pseudanabaena sp. RU_4_16]|nr:hypothetical protein [Pseudanabaena sp. RU_4_16]
MCLTGRKNTPKPTVTTNRPIPTSAPPKQAPAPEMVPAEETKSEPTKTAPTPNWKERLRQLRQNEEGSTGKRSSAPEPAGLIPVPESL